MFCVCVFRPEEGSEGSSDCKTATWKKVENPQNDLLTEF